MKNSLSKHEARRILVFRIGELGDTLIALPALWAIRRSFPDASIALLGNADEAGRHVTPRQLLPHKGLIDEWLSYPSANTRTSFLDRLGLLTRLRRGRFDTLVYLAPRIRGETDIRRDLLFFRLAGIRNVLGRKGWAPLPSADAGGLPVVEHEADHLLQRLSMSGIEVPSTGRAEFPLELTADERLATGDWLSRNLPQLGACAIVGFGPGSKWPSKIWPEERFAEVGRILIRDKDVFPIVFGGPEDYEIGQRLLAVWGRGANAAGALPVRLAAAALSHCCLYVGNDTGTMHLAAAVATPCVAIMAALDWPGHWRPYGPGHVILRRRVPCEGCLLRVCITEGMLCLKEISVDEVVAACLRKLQVSDFDCRRAGHLGSRENTEGVQSTSNPQSEIQDSKFSNV